MLQKSFSVVLSDMCPPVSGITIKIQLYRPSWVCGHLILPLGVLSWHKQKTIQKVPFLCPKDKNDNGVLQKGLFIKLLDSLSFFPPTFVTSFHEVSIKLISLYLFLQNSAGFANRCSERRHG